MKDRQYQHNLSLITAGIANAESRSAADQRPQNQKTNSREVRVTNVAINFTSGHSDDNRIPQRERSAPNAPIGASFITIFTKPKHRRVAPQQLNQRLCSAAQWTKTPNPNKNRNSAPCRMSPFANASTTVWGDVQDKIRNAMCLRNAGIVATDFGQKSRDSH